MQCYKPEDNSNQLQSSKYSRELKLSKFINIHITKAHAYNRTADDNNAHAPAMNQDQQR